MEVTEDKQIEDMGSDEDCRVGSIVLDRTTCDFYRDTLRVMEEAGIPYLIGGAYAFENYTGISRHTKDLDLFVRPHHAEPALEAFARAGYTSEMLAPHWLGKAYKGDLFVDVIFSSGNGLSDVDDAWFENAADGTVLGMPVKLCPPEEMIWTKAFIQERERYDGADVAHLFRSYAEDMDWERLMRRFGRHWRVLLQHLVVFGFIYPSEREKIPGRVMEELIRRLKGELKQQPPRDKIMQGTLISRQQYLFDIEQLGYEDAREDPTGNMSPEEIDIWTESIETGK